jgi:hypothetical protein
MADLTSFRELDLDLDEREARRHELVEQERFAAEQLRPFDGPAWDVIRPIVQQAHDVELANLAAAKLTAEQLWQCRGRVQGFAWLLDRRQELEHFLAMIRQELERHDREGTDDAA